MKDYLIKFYDDTRQYFGTYHNHKEISAWAGLAIHVLFCGIISAVNLPKASKCSVIGSAMGIFLVVIVSAILIYLYIQNQLQMKDKGGALAAAATYILVEILQKNESELKSSDYLEMEENSDTYAQSSHVLPKILIKKSEILNTRSRRFQDRTKLMIYGLLLLSTISVLGLKFVYIFG